MAEKVHKAPKHEKRQSAQFAVKEMYIKIPWQ